MKSYSRVLAAVDFSKPAREAFEYALALSKQHGADLVAIHAVPLQHLFNSDGGKRLALASTLRQRAAEEGVPFIDRVQHGEPAATILLHAQSLGADVIVLGKHQRRGLDRFRTGSVAERVAARATVPVLLVPQRRQASTAGSSRHVAVAVDFSPGSYGAIEQAVALASKAGDRVTLLHAVPGFVSGVPRELYRYGAVEYQAHVVQDAERRLQLAVPVERETQAAIDTSVVVGDPTTAISRAIDSLGADLLVVGVSKRGAVSRTLFGTTGSRLLKVSRVPMLAVPAGAGGARQPERAALQTAA